MKLNIIILFCLINLLFLASCNKHDSGLDNHIIENTIDLIDVVDDQDNEDGNSEDNNGGGSDDENNEDNEDIVNLPKRSGPRPSTTTSVPHIQIGVELIPEVNEELFKRVYSIPGIENRPSIISSKWRSLWLSKRVNIAVPNAIIDDREFGHIHEDGSLHIFLEPSRSTEAVETCWAIFHPYAIQNLQGWDGFIMLYTPQSIDELNVTFQLIVNGYNYVTGESILASDYY